MIALTSVGAFLCLEISYKNVYNAFLNFENNLISRGGDDEK